MLCCLAHMEDAMENDTNSGHAAVSLRNAEIMGEIRSDVKHILLSLPGINQKIDTVERELSDRLTVVEKFNNKALGVAIVAMPILTFIGNWLFNKFELGG